VGPELTGEGFCRIRGHTALTIDEQVSGGSDAVLGTDSAGFADNLMRRSTMERFVKRVQWRAWALRWIDLYGGWPDGQSAWRSAQWRMMEDEPREHDAELREMIEEAKQALLRLREAASRSDSLGKRIPYKMLIAEFEALYRGHVVRVMGDHDSSALTWMQRENGDWGILESAIGRCMTLQTAREDETKAVRKAAMMTLLLKMWCIQKEKELSECTRDGGRDGECRRSGQVIRKSSRRGWSIIAA
jgi:hypothetical protein